MLLLVFDSNVSCKLLFCQIKWIERIYFLNMLYESFLRGCQYFSNGFDNQNERGWQLVKPKFSSIEKQTPLNCKRASKRYTYLTGVVGDQEDQHRIRLVILAQWLSIWFRTSSWCLDSIIYECSESATYRSSLFVYTSFSKVNNSFPQTKLSV